MGTRLAVLVALILGAASRELHESPNVSTTALGGKQQQHLYPLVVLRADTPPPGGERLPPLSELEIFSEDPNWDSKVLQQDHVLTRSV